MGVEIVIQFGGTHDWTNPAGRFGMHPIVCYYSRCFSCRELPEDDLGGHSAGNHGSCARLLRSARHRCNGAYRDVRFYA
jgi:hypothetical protein